MFVKTFLNDKETRKRPKGTIPRFFKTRPGKLLAFEAIAAGALFLFAGTGVAHMDLRKRAVVARTVILTFGDAAADAGIDFFFVHHSLKNLLTHNLRIISMYKFLKDY